MELLVRIQGKQDWPVIWDFWDELGLQEVNTDFKAAASYQDFKPNSRKRSAKDTRGSPTGKRKLSVTQNGLWHPPTTAEEYLLPCPPLTLAAIPWIAAMALATAPSSEKLEATAVEMRFRAP